MKINDKVKELEGLSGYTIELIEQRRIALIPEWEGGWHVDIYDDEDTVQYSGYGNSVDEAITDALSPK